MKIAICGRMGSGKSYLAEQIKNKYEYKITSFAKRLKELAVELFNMKNKDRGLLINFGSKMREIDANVWINAMLNDIKDVNNVVLDDLRLMNEYNILKDKGWFLIKIKIDEEIRQNRLKTKYGDDYDSHVAHSGSKTENDVIELDDSYFDFVLNSENINELFKIIEKNIV